MGIIYKITSPSNKVYIGQTINTLEKRWKEHIYDCNDPKKNHCKALNNAIKKYGHSVFKVEIIEECNEIEKLNELEYTYINLYNSIIPKRYNIKYGGGNFGFHSQETKDKIKKYTKK